MELDQSIEADFRDRAGLMLPGRQQELISKVAAASKGPIILVLMSGGPTDVSFTKNNPKIQSILWVGYPGQAGGAAIADALFGTHNPGGKLPMTWYKQEYLNNLPMTTMDMRSDPSGNYPGRSYRFYKGHVVYPFGHGLSYAIFMRAIVDGPKVVSIPVDGRHHSYSTAVSSKTIQVTYARCKGLSLSLFITPINLSFTAQVEHGSDTKRAKTVIIFFQERTAQPMSRCAEKVLHIINSCMQRSESM